MHRREEKPAVRMWLFMGNGIGYIPYCDTFDFIQRDDFIKSATPAHDHFCMIV